MVPGGCGMGRMPGGGGRVAPLGVPKGGTVEEATASALFVAVAVVVAVAIGVVAVATGVVAVGAVKSGGTAPGGGMRIVPSGAEPTVDDDVPQPITAAPAVASMPSERPRAGLTMDLSMRAGAGLLGMGACYRSSGLRGILCRSAASALFEAAPFALEQPAMGQDLRVASWLRFGNKAQLAKGLRAFAQHAPTEYFDADSWELGELDATLRLDTELAGDFTNVERPFLEMIRAAAFGYVDYYEAGNDKIHAGRGTRGPLKRWAVGQIAQKIILPYGTMGLGYAGKDEALVVLGSFRYADEAAARKLASAHLRFPYLLARGARELRLGPEDFVVAGSELSLALAITGPSAALEEPLVELLRALAHKALSGAMTFQGSNGQTRVEPKGKPRSSLVSKPIVAPPEARKLGTVDAAEPLAAPAPAPEPEVPAPAAKRGAKKGKAADEGVTPFPKELGHVAGAKLLSGERLLVWGGGKVTTVSLADLAPLHVFSVATEMDPAFAWPVLGVVELPSDRAVVFHDMSGDLDLLNLATGERRILAGQQRSIVGVTVAGERFLGWSHDGTVSVFTFEGERERVINTVGEEGYGGVDQVLVRDDGSFVVVARQRARRYHAATGELLEDHGERSDVHALPGGRLLLEKFGVFELHGGAGVSFTVDPGNSHEVYPLGDEEVLIPVRRSLEIASLRDGSVRSGPTGHTKDIGELVSLGGDVWVSHARSMPGLNERFGFDGTLRVWDQAGWIEQAVHDFKAPIRALIALPEQRVAVLLDDVVRGKELPIYSARSHRLVQTIKGAKKPIAGALALPGDRLFTWSRDGLARVIAL